jgi:hypothetical protein
MRCRLDRHSASRRASQPVQAPQPSPICFQLAKFGLTSFLEENLRVQNHGSVADRKTVATIVQAIADWVVLIIIRCGSWTLRWSTVRPRADNLFDVAD